MTPRQGSASLWSCVTTLAFSCLAAVAAQAQEPTLGRIDGRVTDSLHAGARSGALVFLARRRADTTVSRSTTTDVQGRFTFDSLPAGDYVIAVESPLLDSLELSLPPSMVVVARGEPTQVRIALPSGATLRTLVCPAALLPAGIGALTGSVTDASNDQPLRGVALAVSWTETTVDPATLHVTNVAQGASVETDSLGRFLVCGVPTDTYLDLRAWRASYQDVLLQLVIPDNAGVGRQDLALGRAEHPVASIIGNESTGADSVATIIGSVYGTSAPLPEVQVQREGDVAIVTTDSLGRFRFGDVPLGTQVLELRRVGFLPRQLTITVRPGANRTPDVHLAPITTLDPINVVADRAVYREFESRAKTASFGDFLRADDIERKHPHLTSDLLQHMPDFVVHWDSTSFLDVKIYQSGGPTSWTTQAPCPANIVIDGVAHQMINWIDPPSIGAMEIYRGTATGPIQYRSACGTILIWSKRYMGTATSR